MIIDLLLLGIIMPAAVTAFTGVVWWRLYRGRAAEQLLPAAALALGYVCGHAAVMGGLQLWPVDVTHYAMHLAVAAGLWAMAAARFRARPSLLWLGDMALSLLAAALLLRPLWGRSLQGGTGVAVLLAAALGFLLTMRAMQRAREALPVSGWALAMAALLGSAAALFAASGSLVVGRLMGVGAAAAGGLGVAAWRLKSPLTVPSGPRVAAALLWICSLLSLAYANLDTRALAALAVVAPAIALAAQAFKNRSLPLRVAAIAGAVLLPMAVAGVFTVLHQGAAQTPPTSGDSGASGADEDYGYGYQ